MQIYVVALFLAISSFAWAQIAVISDIDDTIKVSHVLDRSESVVNAFRTHNVFRGMPQLYQLLENAFPESEFFYVTNAPRALMENSHSRFLSENQFPLGHLLLRESLSDPDHKITTIRRILNRPGWRAVIFIGDNGERDTQIYAQAVKEFPRLPSATFIRQAYVSREDWSEDVGAPLEPGQFGFVTPIEVALSFQRMGLFKDEDVLRLENFYVPPTIDRAVDEDVEGEEGTLSFPNWVDCREFQIPRSLLRRQTPLAHRLVVRLRERCSRPAPED
ncbi:MAG: phosphatidate phosphatase App1 family protein [Bdellovibrionales bacterium]